ncbi:MAG TPA: helix-hairpin-helix domain-containing protein [Microthrixaceae bacterium]|nr:helix-hairpin-helix domain-containing protein [Microthrixaceae bacterium]
MEPLDPLDQLLRGRSAPPWAERIRTVLSERRPWFVAGGVIVAVVIAILLLRSPSGPAEVTLPRAGTEPAGVTVAAAPSGGATGGAADGTASTTVPRSGSSVDPGTVVVHVAGAVAAPGLVTLPAGSRVADAVARAGGLRADADGDRINLAAPVSDGVRVFIPVVGQPDPPLAVAVTGGPAESASATPSPTQPLDLNTATAEQLEALPGVGPSTAAAIVAYRTEHGQFRSVDELQEVRGIGPAKFEAVESSVTVGP